MVNLTIGIEEEDLESKSTLGMSDYVRVVGADGVSYKQELDDVSNKVITEYTDIPLAGNNQSVKDAINTLDNQVSNKAEESDLQDVESDLTVLGTRVDQLQSSVGTPLVASTVAGMTNHDKIYVYVGSETGYTNGNWYYWDGTGWVSGGVYNSTAFETDKTLTLSDRAADAKVVGDELTNVKSALNYSLFDGNNVFNTKVTSFNNNTAVTNNNDGTYTIGTSDYGNTTFGGTVHLKAGVYKLYGVPQGKSHVGTSYRPSDAIVVNESSTGNGSFVFLRTALKIIVPKAINKI